MSTSEKGSVVNSCDCDQPKESSRPKNVPLRLWEKFQALDKRTNEVTKRSTEKRIKHLQKTALENVARAFHHTDDQVMIPVASVPDTDHQTAGDTVSSSTSSCSSKSRSASAAASRKRPAEHTSSPGESKEDGKETVLPSARDSEEKEWQEVRGLLGVNDHLAGMSHGSLGPKTVLELRIDDAVSRGDYKMAEELSDYMSTREFGEKVAKAIDARNFLKHKEEEEEMAKEKRKKKLHWGFEAKHRWETKSNM